MVRNSDKCTILECKICTLVEGKANAAYIHIVKNLVQRLEIFVVCGFQSVQVHANFLASICCQCYNQMLQSGKHVVQSFAFVLKHGVTILFQHHQHVCVCVCVDHKLNTVLEDITNRN